jgi:hypothetical protein
MKNLTQFKTLNTKFIKGGLVMAFEEEFDIWVKGLSDMQIKEIYIKYNYATDSLWAYFKANVYNQG